MSNQSAPGSNGAALAAAARSIVAVPLVLFTCGCAVRGPARETPSAEPVHDRPVRGALDGRAARVGLEARRDRSPQGVADGDAPSEARRQDPPSGAASSDEPTADGTQRPATGNKVVVTARKIAEPLQDVPQSVTAFTEREIRDAGADSIDDLSRYVPNALVPQFTARRLQLPYIRGVGSGDQSPAVTTFIDGVPQLTTSSTNLPLFASERVEFVRGPSSALYGRNTLGGSINITTGRPTNDVSAEGAVTLGNFQREEYQASVSGPLIEDELYADFAFRYASREGFTINDVTGRDVDSRDATFARGAITWTPDDENSVRLSVYGEAARDGGFVLSDLAGLRSRPNRIQQDFEGSVNRDVFAATLNWTHERDDVAFTSLTGFQRWQIAESSDFDFTPIDGVRRFTDEEQTYVYQEFRLASTEDGRLELGDGVRLGWLGGISGFVSDNERSATNDFRPGGAGIFFPPTQVGRDRAVGEIDARALSVFGQLTLHVHDDLEIAAALRYDIETRKADNDRTFDPGGFPIPTGSIDETRDFDELLPRFSIAYDVYDDARVYALASRGFKAGGFNLAAPPGFESFGTETSWTYEVGTKTDWFDDKLSVNVALFYIEWDDMQLGQFDATSGGFTTNAGESTSQGVEVEMSARPLEGLDLFGSFGFLDTEFESFVDSFGQNVAGNDLPFAPETTGSAGTQYAIPIADDVDAFVRVEFFHVGQFFYDAGNLGQESYELVNFRYGFRGEHWGAEMFIENAFDERYEPIAFQPNPADPTQFVGESAAPLTFGFIVRGSF